MKQLRTLALVLLTVFTIGLSSCSITFSGHDCARGSAPASHASASNQPPTSSIWLEGDPLNNDLLAIQKVGEQLDQAWDQRDAVAFSALFLPSGTFRFPGGTLLDGKEQIASYYQNTAFPSFDADLIHRTTPQRIQFLSPSVAVADGVVHFYHTEAQTPEERLHLTLYVSSTLVRECGKWRIAAVRLIPVS